eukprot:1056296-Alexandrium_andersonii.AAC.1
MPLGAAGASELLDTQSCAKLARMLGADVQARLPLADHLRLDSSGGAARSRHPSSGGRGGG